MERGSKTITDTEILPAVSSGFGLAVPTLFAHSVGRGSSDLTTDELASRTLDISRASAVLLMVAYFVFLFFQTHTHHGIFDAIFAEDEERDHDPRDKGGPKPKFTLVESVVALCVAIPLVTLIAIVLVDEIPSMVKQYGVTEAFMGLILVPLVEKAAEHLGAVDEAWDNQMNFALSHVLGATLQTALFNAPLVVLVAWGMGRPFGLTFELFDIAMLILTIITVGQFLRDQKSNYLEGALCVTVYVAIAVAAFYYPKTVNIIATGSE
jgi:Ca2+:H+ antiporter